MSKKNKRVFTNEVIAKPLETSQTSVAVAEKWGAGARVPGKFGGFAITSFDTTSRFSRLNCSKKALKRYLESDNYRISALFAALAASWLQEVLAAVDVVDLYVGLPDSFGIKGVSVA